MVRVHKKWLRDLISSISHVALSSWEQQKLSCHLQRTYTFPSLQWSNIPFPFCFMCCTSSSGFLDYELLALSCQLACLLDSNWWNVAKSTGVEQLLNWKWSCQPRSWSCVSKIISGGSAPLFDKMFMRCAYHYHACTVWCPRSDMDTILKIYRTMGTSRIPLTHRNSAWSEEPNA